MADVEFTGLAKNKIKNILIYSRAKRIRKSIVIYARGDKNHYDG